MKKIDGANENKIESFDRIVLLVGSADQKNMTQSLLSSVFRRCGADVRIVADGDDGGRLGSGGAVLRVLHALAEETALANGRFLLINCGGQGRRTPNYSFCSKALIPAGPDGSGEAHTCFSHILKNAALLGRRMAPGVLICCADILIDASEFTDALSEDASFCVATPAATGARHGVMVADGDGRLTAYYQKATERELLACAADDAGTVDLEAGWTYFSAATAMALARAAAEHAAQNGAFPRSNLYEDVIPLFAANTDRERYLATDADGLRRRLVACLPNAAMRVYRLRQPFLHYGTLSELLRHTAATYPGRKRFLFQSILGEGVSVGDGTLLDHARVTGASVVGAGCVLSDIDLQDVTVPDGTSVFGLRLRDGRFVAVASAIETEARYAAETADALWNASLFYPADSFSESLRACFAPSCAEAGMPFPECLAQADPDAFMEWRHYLEDLLKFGQRTNIRYDGFRQRVLSSYYGENAPMERLACVREAASVRLPVRVNFSGTWTDCMPYCIENGGAVVNAAVTVNGAYPVSISARRIPEKRIEFCNGENPTRIAVYDPRSVVSDYTDFGMHHAVFQTLGIDAGTEIADGLRLTVQVSGLVKGSGLGISSILLYGCFSVLSKLCGQTFSERELLTKTFVAEQLMRTGGGWQDQGALIGGGVKVVSAPPGLPQLISVAPVDTTPDFLRRLSERLVLIPTGRRHFGRFIVADVMDRYLLGESRTALREMEALNRPLIQSVQTGDLSLFAETVNAHSECLKRLSPLIYSEDISSLRDKCLQYADACCICGAGGGGYLWAIRKETVPETALSQALQTEIDTAEIV